MPKSQTVEQEAAEVVRQLQALLTGEDSLSVTVQRVKDLQSVVEPLKGLDPAKIMEELDKFRASQERMVTLIRGSKRGFYVPGIEDEKFSMLKAMIAIKTGDWKDAGKEQEILRSVREKASQVIGNDKLGGHFVPDQVIPEVIAAIYTRSVFLNLGPDGTTRVSVLEGLQGGNVKIPKFDGGLIAYWIGEEDEYAESQTNVGDVTLNPKKIGVLVRLTDSMRRFQGFGFENLLRNDMVRALAKKVDWTIPYGLGTNDMPLGLFRQAGIKIFRAENGVVYDQNTEAGRTALAAITDWDGGELDFDGLDDMMGALEDDDIVADESFAFISAPRYFRRQKQLKVDNFSGHIDAKPYLLGMPMLSDARLRELIGDFDKSTQIPTTSKPGASVQGATDSTNEKYTDVISGNLNNILFGRWGGIEIEDDGGKGKGFTSDHTYMKLRMYGDMCVRQPRSLIVCPDAKARD